ncbi:MAG TPA: hypothetical protein VGL81_12515 [Polyangiaceae bacterium]
MTRTGRLLFAVPLAAFLAACSSSSGGGAGEGGAAAPVQGTYTIVFPALSVAVDADTILVDVFAAGEASSQCVDLINAQKGGASLPQPLVPSQPVSICSLDSAGVGSLSLGFGSYAVLVVAQKAGSDIAIGCAQQTITEASPNITVTIDDDIAKVVVPPTPCMSLSAFCANQCGM